MNTKTDDGVSAMSVELGPLPDPIATYWSADAGMRLGYHSESQMRDYARAQVIKAHKRAERQRRRVAARDKKIAGLKRRIADLEHALAVKDIEVKRLPRDVTRAVQEALCNVRMIPVLGVGGDTRIVEVRAPKA